MRYSKVVICIILLFAINISCFADSDVPSSWANNSIENAKTRYLLGDKLFSRYGDNITRAEFAFLGVKLYEELTDESAVTGNANFVDSTDPYVLKAKNLGLVSGYPDGSFKPDAIIRRDELATLFVKTLKVSKVSLLPKSTKLFDDDLKIGYWAKEAVYIAKSNGIINGVGENRFNPYGNATREQSLFVFEEILQKYKGISNANLSEEFDRIVVSSGENPSNEINVSWETHSNIQTGKIRIAVNDERVSFPHIYEEFYADVISVPSIYNNKKYQFNGYQVRLEKLLPNTEYIYIVGDGVNWSTPRIFDTIKNDSEDKLLLLGDIQAYKSSHFRALRDNYESAKKLLAKIELTLIAGDVVNHSNRLEQWKQLDNEFGNYLSSNIIVATPGNHDTNYGSDIFENTFIGPLNGVIGLENKNYWVEMDNGFIAVWNTEDISSFENQAEWLKKSSGTSGKPFKLVLMHRSVYPIQYNEQHIRTLAKVFEEADIDLVLSGHDHIYSRTTMLNNEMTKVNEGVNYVVGGSSSGSKFYAEKDINGGRYWRNIVFDQDLSVFSTIVINKSRLLFRAYANDGENIRIIDEFSLYK